MAEEFPAEKYGTVVGQFKVIQIDTQSDIDQFPDFLPARGTVTFKASIPYVQNIQGVSGQSVTYLKTEIKAVLDEEGYLSTGVIDPNTGKLERGVKLLATDNTELTPRDWTYQAVFNLTASSGNFAGSLKPLDFALPGGLTKDLTEMIPVTQSNGVPVIAGPQGEVGPIGPANTLRVGTVIASPSNTTEDARMAENIRTGPETQLAFEEMVPLLQKGDKGDPGGWVTTPLQIEDLNTVVITGLYVQGDSGKATLSTNYPVVAPGTLEVIARHPTSITQRYTPFGGTMDRVFFTRQVVAGVPTPWRTFPSTRVDNTAGRAIYQWDDTNNRDQLIYGDTGMRRNALTFLNGAVDADGGGTRLSREGYFVSLYMTAQVTGWVSGTQLTAIPEGFRPAHTGTLYMPSSYGSPGACTLFSSNVTLHHTGDGYFRWSWSWRTNDLWPTTLPGIANGVIPNL